MYTVRPVKWMNKTELIEEIRHTQRNIETLLEEANLDFNGNPISSRDQVRLSRLRQHLHQARKCLHLRRREEALERLAESSVRTM